MYNLFEKGIRKEVDRMYPMKLKPIYDKTIWANDRLTTMRGMEEKGMAPAGRSVPIHMQKMLS